MKNIVFIGLFFVAQIGFAQVKELKPTTVTLLNFSEKGEKQYNDTVKRVHKIWEKQEKQKDYKLTKEEQKIVDNFSEAKDDYWSAVEGCSWYCGNDTKQVTASSSLKPQGKINYKAENAHDLDYKNVWAEGVKGYGIGENLTYTFPATTSKITEIIIANGYVKSEKAYKENSRVKKLKVYINNKPYAVLNLKDIRSAQSFKVDILGYTGKDREDWKKLEKKPDFTVKFEILEVYKGEKYDDTVISEIFFDGIHH